MENTLRTAVIASAIFTLTIAGFAQVGSLDSDFATAGQYVQDFGAQDNLTKVRIQPGDQKIVAVGTALSPGFAGQLLVLRLNPDGTLDNTFNGTGTLVITAFNESYAYDLFFQPDSKIVVVGARADANFQFSMLAMRLNTDGTLDNTFGTGGFSDPEISVGDDFAYAVAPMDNGQMILAGSALDGSFNNQPVVVLMNADGSIDNTFGTGGVASIPVTQLDNRFSSVGLQSDGSIVASGHFDQGLTGGGQTNHDVLAARFTSSGQLDAAFGTGGTVVKPISTELREIATSMAIGPDDGIYLAGFTTQPDFSFDAFVMKLDADGADDPSFGTDGLEIFDNAVQDVFYGIALQPDGKVLACGTSGGFFFDPRDQLVARFNSDGTLDNAYDMDGFSLDNVAGNFDEANSITLQADGKIVTAGKANTVTLNDASVFRYLNDLNTTISEDDLRDELGLFPNPAQADAPIMISVPGPIQGMRLFNSAGAEIAMVQRPAGSGTWRVVDLPADLAPGVYSMQVIANGRVATTRLIVQD